MLFAVFLLVLSLALLHNYYISTVKEKIAASKIVHIFSSGILNKNIIKNFEFRGYAIDKSGFSNKMLVLINTKKYNWADASIDFKFPMDLSRRKLSLTIKGKIGGERISLVLLDSNNRSYRLNDIYLASNWNTDTISFDNIKGGIDLSKITQLRFEYGYVGESSKLMDSLIELTVYIKNIELIKEA